mgnify:FL=1
MVCGIRVTGVHALLLASCAWSLPIFAQAGNPPSPLTVSAPVELTVEQITRVVLEHNPGLRATRSQLDRKSVV